MRIVVRRAWDGLPVRLEIEGLHDATAPLQIRAACAKCRAVLSERTYDAADAGAVAAAGDHAVADAVTGLAHQCGGRS